MSDKRLWVVPFGRRPNILASEMFSTVYMFYLLSTNSLPTSSIYAGAAAEILRTQM